MSEGGRETGNKTTYKRRDILKVGGLVGGLVAGGGVLWGLLKLEEKYQEKRKLVVDPKEALAKHELGDFYGLYKTTKDFYDTYGYWPLRNKKKPGRDFLGILLRVGENKASLKEIEAIRDGWKEEGIEIESFVPRAIKKVNEMKIEKEENLTTDDVKTTKKLYLQMAEFFPGLVLAAPNILKAGLAYISPQEDTIALPSPSLDGEGAYVAAIHELGHISTDWKEVKQFVDKKTYIDFMHEQVLQTKEALDDYFGLDWAEAKGFKNGEMLIQDNPIKDRRLRVNLEELIRYKVIKSEPSEEILNKSHMLFNWIVHQVGKHYLDNPYKEISVRDKEIFESVQIARSTIYSLEIPLIKMAVSELVHIFVGPVQKEGGGLPRECEELPSGEGLITRAGIEIQLKRFEAFSILSKKDLAYFMKSNKAMLEFLELD